MLLAVTSVPLLPEWTSCSFKQVFQRKGIHPFVPPFEALVGQKMCSKCYDGL